MSNTKDALQRMKDNCSELANVGPGTTNKLAANLWKTSIEYFQLVQGQAQQSFWMALVAALIGMILFSIAITLMMMGTLPFSKLSLIASVNIQVISAIGFYLYAKTTRQFAAFHVCLERANRFLLANTICNEIKDEGAKDQMRRDLILTIATAPLLSFDVVEHGSSNNDPEACEPSKDPSGNT
jgi:hypothetical protein